MHMKEPYSAGAAAVGLRLRQQRLKRGWSQEGLCRDICAASYLSKIEQGQVQAAPELLELGLSVPQVTKIFLKLREMGVDVPADVYTIPYAVKMILAAKARRDAGATLVLPRNEEQKGGAAGC